jgi:GntR family transcriptional regulator
MFFDVDPSNGVPIYEQVVRQVVYAVAAEALRAGDLVPSVRELARELAINPNTVARAYRQLQDDGVLDSVRGTGLAIAPDALEKCRDARVKFLQKRLRQLLVEARQSRLDPGVFRGLIEAELAAMQGEEV